MTARKGKGPEGSGPDITTPAGFKEYLARDFLELCVAGDQEAVLSLHAVLAEALRKRELTPFLMDLLADMHEAIADGETADAAMFAQKPSNRPSLILRDRRITNDVDGQISMYRFAEREPSVVGLESFKAPNDTEIFRRVAKEYGLDWKTVKKIYLKNRPRQAPQGGAVNDP